MVIEIYKCIILKNKKFIYIQPVKPVVSQYLFNPILLTFATK